VHQNGAKHVSVFVSVRFVLLCPSVSTGVLADIEFTEGYDFFGNILCGFSGVLAARIASSILAALSEAGGDVPLPSASKPLPPHSSSSAKRHLECTLAPPYRRLGANSDKARSAI
jgi:hypothetical protein